MPEELGEEIEPGAEETGGLAEETGGQREAVPWDDHVKLRHENAEYRKKWGPYEEAFGGFDDDGRSGWMDFIKLAQSDPEAARAQMLYSLIGEDGLAALGFGDQQGGEEQYPEQPQYLTREEFQAQLHDEFARREEAQSEEAAVAGVEDQAEQLGYEPGSLEYMQLLHLALTEHDGDLEAAHQAMGDWRQGIVNDFLKTKSDDGTPSPVTPGMGPGGEQKSPKDISEASKAFGSFLGSQP